MADPLSIAASIVAVVQVSSAVIKSLGELKETTNELRRLQTEIDSLQNVLVPTLQRLREGGEETATKELLKAHGLLDEICLFLEQLKNKIAPVTGLNKARRAVTYKFQQAEVKSILGTIERLKSLFSLTLQSEAFIMWQNTQQQCYRNQKEVQEVRESLARLREDNLKSGFSIEVQQDDGYYAKITHCGSNYGGSNVVYGGSQVFAGATICFGGS